MNTIIKNILKFSLAFGLIYWLIQSGKLDFKLLKQALESPFTILLIMALMLFDHFIVAIRLRIILKKKSQKALSYIKIFLSNWIGIFFNSVLPGSVSGDVIKIFYLKNMDEKFDNKFLLMAVFVDRLLGLIGLITIGGIVSAINYNLLSTLSEDVKYIIHFNLVLLAGVILTLIILFFFDKLPHQLARPFRNIKYLGTLVRKLEVIWNDIYLFRNKILTLLGLSMLIQGIAICIFWYLVAPYAVGEFKLSTAFTVLPAGFISLAIPISPGGLGVGHVVFGKLLSYFGVQNGENLFNIYFFFSLFTNLTGVFPYLFYRNKKQLRPDITKAQLEN